MKLSENFTLEELTVTSVDADNTPNPEHIANLQRLVDNVLQPLRKMYGKPIKINSGYRSKEVNNAIKGSSTTSSHCNGEAADLDCEDNALLFSIIRETLTFDQVINEQNFSWIHVSYRQGNNRNQALEMKNGKYYPI
jgi:hypothetical protein